MPLLNFKARFAPDVESGLKDQSIRARRKDGRDPKPGDRLYLYTGCRTKHCRKLGEAICRSVEEIDIFPASDAHSNEFYVGDEELSPRQALALAKHDGFATVREMRNFFDQEHGLPFHGLLIRWRKVT